MSRSYTDSDQAARNGGDSAELKLYQAFIFSVPVLLTFILLLLFYLFYLRLHRFDWSSLRMRASLHGGDGISRCELGLKKEHRELLPIIVFRESFSVKDTQCPVCLADYLAEDRLQQIPACGHTFHMVCIDLWLSTHTTCPLCRQSLIAPPTASIEPSETPETWHQPREEASASQESSDSSVGNVGILPTGS
ncbi:RING-H2 finger protein ATL58-like [Diospyros lotus]|uniref:RING-H2 finger protein ATL58-like n=1 Tax=Diospyros lotus TaxID=55363 RepID=UPI0022524E65|nr:RING-H2 finger protein ATL58-like [Diospyros lotus]